MCNSRSSQISNVKIITAHTATLGNLSTDLLPTIYAFLISDVWLTPLLRLSDWMSNLKKHVLAPRADTQAEMNAWFQGTYYNLGERYTVSFSCCDISWFSDASANIG
jgi:hypothetical protein